MKKNKMMKRVVTLIMTAIMLVVGVNISPKKANAAGATELTEISTENDKVLYEEMTVAEFEKFYGDDKKVAPTKEGYLFGGWYLDSALENPVVSKSDVTRNVYAKFVPAYVLSVKAQNYASTKATGGEASEDNKTTTRVVASVDESLLYQEVGFKVILPGKDEVITKKTTKVWEKLAVGTGDSQKTYETTKIFGKASKYFFVLNVNNIPETKWGDAIYVRPYWITEDGTEVEGLGKHVYTEDGVKGYISVPINLKNVTEGMAAGVLKVTYDSSLTFKESVTGRVFEEMEINAQSSYVKCVGNVSTLADVKKDDIYITLRFEVSKTMEARDDFYKFVVSEEDFASVNEGDVTFNVWDVQY